MKALELADQSEELAKEGALIHVCSSEAICKLLAKNAAELRRLAEVNAELVVALENMIAVSAPDETGFYCTSDIENAAYFARGTLFKAKEQQ